MSQLEFEFYLFETFGMIVGTGIEIFLEKIHYPPLKTGEWFRCSDAKEYIENNRDLVNFYLL